MLFCINSIYSDMIAGMIASIFFWSVNALPKSIPSLTNYDSLPGAIGMYALAVGVSHVGATLPKPVYPLLSGLNAATVGIIALAGVRLAGRAISDKTTRFWVYLGGFMGMLYSALWSVSGNFICVAISLTYFVGTTQ